MIFQRMKNWEGYGNVCNEVLFAQNLATVIFNYNAADRSMIGRCKKEPGIPFSEDVESFIVGINFRFQKGLVLWFSPDLNLITDFSKDI